MGGYDGGGTEIEKVLRSKYDEVFAKSFMRVSSDISRTLRKTLAPSPNQ